MVRSPVNDRYRQITLAAVVLLFVVCGIVNYFYGTIGLRPVATACVILFTLYTGLIPGLAAATVATGLYTWVGFVAPWASVASRNPLTTLIFFVTNILCAIVASNLRARIAQNAELERTKAQLEASEHRYRTLGEFIPFGIWQTDRDDKLVYMSKSFLDMVGMSLSEIADRGWLERVPPDDARKFIEMWNRKDETIGVWESEYRIRGADQKTYTIHSRGTRLVDEKGEFQGWVGVSYDITDSKRAIDRLNFLAEAGRLLSSSLDPDTTLDRIAALCVPHLADWCGIDIAQDDGSLVSVAIKHTDPAKIQMARDLQSEYPPAKDEPNGTYQVMRTGVPMLLSEIPDSMLVAAARDERHLALLRELGISSAMVVPLMARQRRIGVVTFVDAESGRRFDQSDLEFATILCARAALAYDNARLFVKEQRVAETFQSASLPTDLPRLPGMRISATYRAGQNESEVGGDWYDAFELPDGNVVISIGDVAGKGLMAAVAMSAVRQILCAAAFEGAGPADMLRRCNRVICHRGTGMVTAAIGMLSPDTRRFTYATAGHPPVLYADKHGAVRELTTTGIPLGILPEYVYTEAGMTLDETGLIVFYTDGLTEFNRNIEVGERELARVVGESVGMSKPNLADTIVREVITGKPLDDIAVLTVELHQESFDTLDIRVPATTSSARVIRRSLRRLCMTNGLSEDQMFRVLVATGEAVSNAIEHAYSSGSGSVRVRGSKIDGSIVIQVSDEGRWRRGTRREGGRGLDLMRRLMDEVVIDQTEAGTEVRQRLKINEQSQ